MTRWIRRRPRPYRPRAERFEDRLLLTAGASTHDAIASALYSPPGASPVRPNTPVLPFGAAATSASFVDPSVRITYGKHVEIGRQSFIAPDATLNAGPPGYIKIGSASTVQDDAVLLGNPDRLPGAIGVVIGDNVYIGPGATVRGPARVGGFGNGAASAAASVGANALIDGGTVSPGAIVSALARVGPGVTIPAGFRVLPGANVTTQAEAGNPSLGKVVPVTAADLAALNANLSNNVALAGGYATLYQGNPATGASPGVNRTGINNGDLATVLGTSAEPGTTAVKFEPASQGPRFLVRSGQEVQGLFSTFPARITGQVIFGDRPSGVARHLGRGNSIRGDEGQPITIGSIAQTGRDVSIHSPISGTITIGRNLTAGNGARIQGGPAGATTLGNDVAIGTGAVVCSSAIGSSSTIGPRSYVSGSTLPPGTVVPAGTILINNKDLGTIQW